ncbi:polysaccharide pyruvyl transferase family protein [Bacteroides thetaiotaomicron]|uniref:Polysaccharide pyruvyl transferase n=1 Tax=Bacteroides thetaiotaomicron TaxID=818 RepID=A0A174QL00_BACT4|nr:polysaccharide pyruvyl transferase family protein [Bacteroides thetaiotaomicron]MCE8949401.1 polysaccharide pyruvyl transferase family protein [Bacteroides thetaiotaomicron]MCE8967465.1 polysaccharide pyruvyl transferase family protein [Bacteroides thetaiotaomicron]CUP72641.1 Polysaccharide pyruvyl transferase [Bacteroides thetaiotaomicron]
MRIGILTFHRALNYGAVLQCYALQKVIKDLGHEVEVIDYRPDYIEKDRDINGKYSLKHAKGGLAKMKVMVTLFLSYIYKRRAKRVFDNFISNYYVLSSNSFTDIDDMPQDYNVYILGSDQIWNPIICNGYSPVFWGQFKRNPMSVLATYAASLGLATVSDEEKKLLSTYLRSFDCISVREDSMKGILKDLTTHIPCSVLDPTLLAPIEIFEKIAIKPDVDKYVLLITLEKDTQAFYFASNIARQLGCKVVRLSALSNFVMYVQENSIKKIAVSPEEYCGLFKYATCTVCISFHAIAFSLIFKKDFYALESIKRDRVYNLLSYLGLENRMVTSKANILFTSVSYSNYEGLMEKKRKTSMAYLKKVVQ